MRLASFRRLLALAAVATAPLLAIAQAAGVENNENVFLAPAVNGDIVVANQPFQISWTPSANPGTVSIVLVKGVEPNLQVVQTVAQNVANSGGFAWTPPLTLEGLQTMPATEVYKLKIVNDVSGNFGFSFTFKVDSPGSTFAATGASSSAGPSSTPAPSSSSVSEGAGQAAATDSSSSIGSSSSALTSSIPSSSSIGISSSSIVTSSVPSTTSAASTTSSSISSNRTTLSTITSSSSSSSSKSSTSSSTNSPASAAAETASTSSSTATSTAVPAAATPSKMGTAAVAGITAGTIGAIIIAIAIVFLVRRSKQASRQRLVGDTSSVSGTTAPSKYDRDFQMMERRARHRPTSSFGFNTSRSDASGGLGGGAVVGERRHDPYVQLDDRDSFKRDSGTWMASRF
ncbi:hypothetical protein ABW21_db0208277 [Orbilia brochopaga]|nr:hypothetical protein ABW21_db0208277 [Drechslerella brochopaga]